MSLTPSIQLDNLVVELGKETIINNVSLKIEKGRCVALLGPSGSGKTTLLRTIAGFIKPKSGTVNLFGQNVTKQPPEQRPVSMLFQEPVLFPHLTVKRNATVGFSKEKRLMTQDFTIKRLVEAFRIEQLLDRKIASGLSGGEKQRAALLRTFANAKDILLLDEPLKSALNVELQWQLMRAIKRLATENGRTTLLVTHDFEEAAYLADEIAVIVEKGKELYVGSTDEMYYKPPNLQVARVLGKGTELDADLVFRREKREAMCPFTFQNEAPRPLPRAHTVFIRPDSISVRREGVGFKIKRVSFLGGYSLVELAAQAPASQDEIQVFASSSPQSIFGLGDEVGARLSQDALIAFDQEDNWIPI